MAEDRDFADAEVQGLARFLPTTFAKSLAALVIPGSLGAFTVLRGNMSWFGLEGLPEREQTYIAGIFSLAVFSGILLLIVVDLALVLSNKKHRRIAHYVTGHPILSPRWLFANAETIHWLVIGLMAAAIFCGGFYAGRV